VSPLSSYHATIGVLPGLGIRGLLVQERGFLVVAGTTHGRCRVAPAYGCAAGLLHHLLVGSAEVVQGLAVAIPPKVRPAPMPGISHVWRPKGSPGNRLLHLTAAPRRKKASPVLGTGL
jgi:hypothetical protein